MRFAYVGRFRSQDRPTYKDNDRTITGQEGRMKLAGFFVVSLVAVASLLDPGVVAADEAQFVERDGVLYVFNVPGAGSWAGSASPQYGALIDEMAERYQVPAKFIAAVIKAESNFNPRAVSRKGARGLMQLMP